LCQTLVALNLASTIHRAALFLSNCQCSMSLRSRCGETTIPTHKVVKTKTSQKVCSPHLLDGLLFICSYFIHFILVKHPTLTLAIRHSFTLSLWTILKSRCLNVLISRNIISAVCIQNNAGLYGNIDI